MPRPLLLLGLLGVVAGTVGAWGGLAGWLLRKRADQIRMEQSRAEVRQYILAASRYSEQAIRAEGELSYMRQLPECTAR